MEEQKHTSKGKSIFLVIGLVILLVVGAALATDYFNRGPNSLIGSILISPPSMEAMAKETISLKNRIKKQEENIVNTIRENLSSLKELRTKVDEGIEPSDIKEKVIQPLEKITKSFEDIAERKTEIRKDLLDRVESLRRVGENAQDKIESLKDKKVTLEDELENLEESDPGIQEIKEKGLKQRIEFIREKIDIWEEFCFTHKNIRGKVQESREITKKFLVVIDINAKVYREGLSLLKLKQDLTEAKKLLEELPDLRSLTSKMVASWGELDSLIDDLLGRTEKMGELEQENQK